MKDRDFSHWSNTKIPQSPGDGAEEDEKCDYNAACHRYNDRSADRPKPGKMQKEI